MAKLRIEYCKDRCIGQGNCAALAPKHFQLVNEKAELLNSRNMSDGVYAVETNCNDNDARSIIRAGESCPVNAIRVMDLEKKEDIVGVNVKEDHVRVITAEYNEKEFVIDNNGYFLIRVDREKGNIEAAFCREKNKVALKVIGEKPLAIYHAIINKENLPIRKDQCAYIGRELQKAYIALKNNVEYVQDEELDFDMKVNQ